MKKIARLFVNLFHFLFGGELLLLVYYLCPKDTKEIIKEDYNRSNQEFPFRPRRLMNLLFEKSYKPFRNVFYFRTTRHQHFLTSICEFFIKPLFSIELAGDIAGGFKVTHNYCVVSVEKAGAYFGVMQGVTVGANGGRPTIGDNVMIMSNATVLGKINIGNHVIIGAGTFCNMDIPDKCTVVGNPPRIIRKDGVKTNILLKEYWKKFD